MATLNVLLTSLSKVNKDPFWDQEQHSIGTCWYAVDNSRTWVSWLVIIILYFFILFLSLEPASWIFLNHAMNHITLSFIHILPLVFCWVNEESGNRDKDREREREKEKDIEREREREIHLPTENQKVWSGRIGCCVQVIPHMGQTNIENALLAQTKIALLWFYILVSSLVSCLLF